MLTAFIWAEKTENTAESKLSQGKKKEKSKHHLYINFQCSFFPQIEGRDELTKSQGWIYPFLVKSKSLMGCVAMLQGTLYRWNIHKIGREEVEQDPGTGNKDDIPTTLLFVSLHTCKAETQLVPPRIHWSLMNCCHGTKTAVWNVSVPDKGCCLLLLSDFHRHLCALL